jgi:hypothetical protein
MRHLPTAWGSDRPHRPHRPHPAVFGVFVVCVCGRSRTVSKRGRLRTVAMYPTVRNQQLETPSIYSAADGADGLVPHLLAAETAVVPPTRILSKAATIGGSCSAPPRRAASFSERASFRLV